MTDLTEKVARAISFQRDSVEDHWRLHVDEATAALAACRPAIRDEALEEGWRKGRDDAARAALSAMFGPPTHWTLERLANWHVPDRQPTPEEAAHHDNGCHDAYATIRAMKGEW